MKLQHNNKYIFAISLANSLVIVIVTFNVVLDVCKCLIFDTINIIKLYPKLSDVYNQMMDIL